MTTTLQKIRMAQRDSAAHRERLIAEYGLCQCCGRGAATHEVSTGYDRDAITPGGGRGMCTYERVCALCSQ